MTQYNKPPQQLITEWYKKLKDDGFKDIETDVEHFRNKGHPEGKDIPSKIRYFQLAGQFLYDYKFANKIEKAVWAAHSDGYSMREIAEQLKHISTKSLNKDNIQAIVKKLSTVMLTDYINKDDDL